MGSGGGGGGGGGGRNWVSRFPLLLLKVYTKAAPLFHCLYFTTGTIRARADATHPMILGWSKVTPNMKGIFLKKIKILSLIYEVIQYCCVSPVAGQAGMDSGGGEWSRATPSPKNGTKEKNKEEKKGGGGGGETTKNQGIKDLAYSLTTVFRHYVSYKSFDWHHTNLGHSYPLLVAVFFKGHSGSPANCRGGSRGSSFSSSELPFSKIKMW